MKNTGWVLFCTVGKKYWGDDGFGCGCIYVNLKGAQVFNTRKNARFKKLICDRVLKVEIKNGVAIKVIPGR